MTIQGMLNKISVDHLSKTGMASYATYSDIVSGKSQLEKCNSETVHKIDEKLNVSKEMILAPRSVNRSSFENFKSTICHRVKELGDMDFIIDTLESQDIRMYFERKWYPESLYLLAMLDYLSRENDVPLCDEYDDLRRCRLANTIYPSSILAMSAASKKEDELRRAEAAAIPEFKRFNIIESEIRNVI